VNKPKTHRCSACSSKGKDVLHPITDFSKSNRAPLRWRCIASAKAYHAAKRKAAAKKKGDR
jgi:hypothetical protein